MAVDYSWLGEILDVNFWSLEDSKEENREAMREAKQAIIKEIERIEREAFIERAEQALALQRQHLLSQLGEDNGQA